MPHDPRTYANITHDFADSPKLQIVSVEARWALLEMILYSCRMQTDGVLSKRLAAARWSLDVCQELATNDDEKPSLLDAGDAWAIHDFLEHQTSKEEIEKRREQKRRAGKAGGKAKASRQNKSSSKRLAAARNLPKQTLSSRQDSATPSAKEIRNKKEGGNRVNKDANEGKKQAESIPQSLDELAAAHAASQPDPTRCPEHQHLAPDAVPNCWQCAQARKQHEATKADEERQAVKTRRAAIDACTQCDDLGYVKVANGTVAKCTHTLKGPF